MVTIKDVAREAGVSQGTVSSVLNGKTTVKAENYNKVMDAVKRLNYQPNLTARTLKTGTSNSIGLVIPDITNPYYPELARGVEDAARAAGLTVFLCNNDRDVKKERDYVNALLNKSVDGIIMVKPQMKRDELEEIQRSCNLVLVDTGYETLEGFNVVDVENGAGAKQVMDLLAEYGHERIAYIGGLLESISANARFNAYKNALTERGIEYREEYVRHRRYDWFSGYTAATELMKLVERPTAIFCANDVLAMGALKGLRERNVKVPNDVSVVGFDDIDQSSYSCPALTTVHQPKYEVGIASVDILVKRIGQPRQEEDPGSYVCFDTELVIRETVNYAKTAINPLKTMHRTNGDRNG